MPTTIAGVFLFVGFITPGFLNYLQRRKRTPQRQLSSLTELATFLSVSIAINLFVAGIFSLIRYFLPNHTPNVELLLSDGTKYIFPRVGYVALWSIFLFFLSCAIAVWVGIHPGKIGEFITPRKVDISAWYELFESAPTESQVYVGCDLNDGSYVGGLLLWYNTDIDEVVDRDLILVEPLTLKIDGEKSMSEFKNIILSARNISRIYVSYVTKEADSN